MEKNKYEDYLHTLILSMSCFILSQNRDTFTDSFDVIAFFVDCIKNNKEFK